MRIHVFTLFLVACGGTDVAPLDPMEKDELAYDETSSNLKARGALLGETIEVLEVRELEAIQEYVAPAIPGTEEPDLARKMLVSLEVKALITRDGAPWEIQLDIEADDGLGDPSGSIAPSEALEISFQLENEDETIDLEDDAISGSVEIKRYDANFGGTFDLILKEGGQVTGSFFAPFAEPEVDVD